MWKHLQFDRFYRTYSVFKDSESAKVYEKMRQNSMPFAMAP